MNDRRRLSDLPTVELERLLRSAGLDPRTRQQVADEIGRRFQQELLGTSSGPATYGEPGAPPELNRPGPPVFLPRDTPIGQASSPAPPPQPVSPRRSGGGTAAGCIGVVVGLLLVAFLVLRSQEPNIPTLSRICYTAQGTCTIPTALPLNTSCTCSDGVNLYSGNTA
jgi:hypothetical protein